MVSFENFTFFELAPLYSFPDRVQPTGRLILLASTLPFFLGIVTWHNKDIKDILHFETFHYIWILIIQTHWVPATNCTTYSITKVELDS